MNLPGIQVGQVVDSASLLGEEAGSGGGRHGLILAGEYEITHNQLQKKKKKSESPLNSYSNSKSMVVLL